MYRFSIPTINDMEAVMARRVTYTKDPLAPVESVVQVSIFLVSALLVLFGLFALGQLAISGSTDVTIAGIGDGEACGTLDSSGGGTYVDGYAEDGTSPRPPAGIDGVDEEVARYAPDSYRVCLTDASAVQHIVASAGTLGALVGFYAVGLSILGAVRSARRSGLFVPSTVARVRRLGWLLLATGLLLPVVRAAADGIIVAAAVPGRAWYADIDRLGFSWSVLVTAVGVITVARVLARGVVLQEDVDATI
jgi:hypothetical protein